MSTDTFSHLLPPAKEMFLHLPVILSTVMGCVMLLLVWQPGSMMKWGLLKGYVYVYVWKGGGWEEVCERGCTSEAGGIHQTLADLRGGARDARPSPGGPNSFIFMQFSANIWKIIALLGVGAPPLGKILDSPLPEVEDVHQRHTSQNQRWPLKWEIHILLECIIVRLPANEVVGM